MPRAPKTVKLKKPSLLPLKSDIIFKSVFGDKRNSDILAAFLAVALDLPSDELQELELIDPQIERDFPGDKLCVLDVRVKTAAGKLIDVEIQLHNIPALRERIVLYAAKNLDSQIVAGDDYNKLKKVITIAIFDFDVLPGKLSYHHNFNMFDPFDGTLWSDVMEICTLELTKLPEKSSNAREEELLNWLKLIRAEREEEIEMLAAKTPEIKKTVAVMKKLSSDEKTRLVYEAREKARRDEMTRLNGAREEGLKQGLKQGLEKKALEIARKMLANNLSLELISEYTGLPLDEIQKISAR